MQIFLQNQQYMSTEEIFKEQERSHSLQRDRSTQLMQRTRFKVKRKIGQLQNKAYFFQGQLNPISYQNKTLKQKLVQLNRAVSASTDILRNLLPVQNDPSKKLKLQIAGLQQISGMIKQQWLQMQEVIRCMKRQIQIKTVTIVELEQKLKNTINNYENIIYSQKTKYQTQIMELKNIQINLELRIKEILIKADKQKQQIILSYNQRLQQAEKIRKQYLKFITQANEKYNNYEKLAQRLRNQIAHNLEQFQKSKENIKQIYEGLMQSKLEQQTKQFQYMVKIKEDEKMRMMEQMNMAADQLKKKISQKNSQISHLSGINDLLKEQIGKAKDQTWSLKLQLDKCQKQIKQTQQNLFLQVESNKQMKIKMIENSQKLKQIQVKLEKSIQKYEKQLSQQKNRVSELQIKLIKQRQIYQMKAQQMQGKIKQFKRKIRENDDKFEQKLLQQKNKYEQMIKNYGQNEKDLKNLISQCEQKIKQKQKQISNILKNHDEILRKVEQINQAKLRKIQLENQRKFNQAMSQQQQKLRLLNKDYQCRMSEFQISNNQYIRKIMADHLVKMHQYQTKYRQLQETSQKQLKQANDSLNSTLAANHLLKGQLEQVCQNLKRAVEEHKKSMHDMRIENEKRLEMQKQKLLNEMQQQILMFKKTMDERQAQYKTKLSMMEQTMQKQLNILKQSNAIQAIEQKYLNMITRLKQQAQAKLKKAIEEKDLQIKKNLDEYHQQLNMLSKKLQFDISRLNQELLEQKEAHNFDKMSRQQKIAFLLSKINENRIQMSEKDNQIIDLQFQIDKKNKQLQKVEELVDIKVKKIKKQLQIEMLEAKQQFNMQINKIQSECKAKVKKVETQRIQFTQSLYNQFQDLKNKYQKQLYRANKKYGELQRIFQERPSRAEDLSKIKQLIEQKSKMDIQIKECKKKVRQANQIVKYLNIELENYKDTYDIFGPGGQPLSPQRRYQTEVAESPSPIRSLIKRQNIGGSEENQKIFSSLYRQKQKRINITQSSDLQQFRLFPPLGRNKSQAVEQQDNQSQISNQKQAPSNLNRKNSKQKPMFSKIAQIDDKSQQLKSNASIFMGLISKQQKPPIQFSLGNKGYSRRLSRRKTIAISHDKKLHIKDKTVVFQ